MNKRIASFLMTLLLLFTLCGCDVDFTTDTNNDKVQIEVTDGVINQEAKTSIEKVSEDSTSNYDNGLMRIHFIDVGQADSTFIELNNTKKPLLFFKWKLLNVVQLHYQ